MNFKPYSWQKRLVRIYKGDGIVKGFAGTGKTLGAILVIKDRGYNNVIIGVPTNKLRVQWRKELKKYHIDNAMVETFHILSKEQAKHLKCDLLVVDECHRSTSPVFKKIYENIKFDDILGLSATPNKDSLKYCGGIIIDVPLADAQISDFKVYFHGIDLTLDEYNLYSEYSEVISKWLSYIRRAENDSEKWSFREKLDSMIFKRRSLVYNAEKRIPKAVELLRINIDKPTLVICKRIDQANTISKITGIPVYHSEKPDEKALDDFHNDRISALLSVGMLSEGYDKRNIKCLIIVSTAITEAYHVQSIGRAVRLPEDADIHIILARKTTDEKLLQFRYMYNHEIVDYFSPHALKPKNPWIEQYYLGNEFNIDVEGRIYQKTPEGKQYYKDNPVVASLQRLFNYRSGNFRLTQDNQVIAKSGGKFLSLGILTEPLEKISLLKIKPLSNK
jgi:superfamily II DNA or RNA helicase